MEEVECFACGEMIEGTGRVPMTINADKIYVIFFHLHHYETVYFSRMVEMVKKRNIDWVWFKKYCSWIVSHPD